ncbi:MAG: energy transducer TonB [Thermoanaerobaculia bacterium]
MVRVVFAVMLLVSLPAFAQDAVTIALHVNEPVIDSALLAKAVADADPLTRATAARVITIRGVTGVLATVRDALAAETNANAAREQVRALAILGTDDNVAFAAKQLRRFPSSIDLDFSEAIARRGDPEATALYLRYAPELRRATPFVQHALWGRSNLANIAIAKMLGANDARAVRSMLDAFVMSGTRLDPGVLSAVLEAPSAEIRAAALWYVIARQGEIPAGALLLRDDASVEEAFAREVIRRMGGAKREERPEWLAWLRSREGRDRVPSSDAVRRHLTKKERNALVDEHMAKLPSPPFGLQDIDQPSFRLSIELPPGLAAKILAHTQCDAAAWIGVAGTSVDRVGRLQSLDLSKVTTIGPCKTALKTMLRLSLADPVSFNAPLATNDLQLVKPPGTGCFDEAPVDEFGTSDVQRVGGTVVAPVVVERVEPQLGPHGLNGMPSFAAVVIEAVITRTGCVRDVHVVRQTTSGDLNSAAVSAISKWKFKPGTLDGQPVDVLFTVTVTFRH